MYSYLNIYIIPYLVECMSVATIFRSGKMPMKACVSVHYCSHMASQVDKAFYFNSIVWTSFLGDSQYFVLCLCMCAVVAMLLVIINVIKYGIYSRVPHKTG